jgi:hypothetical protein
MKVARLLLLFLMVFSPSVPAFGYPDAAAGPPKWFHHHVKKNPHQNSVDHPKPSHRATKHRQS